MSSLSTDNLARSAANHPKRTILIWLIVFLVSGGLAGALLQENLSSQWRFLNNPESNQADLLIDEHIGDPYAATEVIIVRSSTYLYDQPEFVGLADEIAQEVLDLGPEIVTSTRDRIVSPDRDAAMLIVRMAGTADEATLEVEKIHEIVDMQTTTRTSMS